MAEVSKDPYGLEKLRETLKIFRELASTKEIITTTTNNSALTEKSSSLSSSTSQEKSQTSESKSQSTDSSSSSSSSFTSPEEWAPYVAGLLLLLGIVVAFVVRTAKANKDAKVMVEAAGFRDGQQASANQAHADRAMSSGGREAEALLAKSATTAPQTREEMAMRMRCDQLKDELIQIFMNLPKVAKETFGRILQEEGVEQAGQYVYLLGQVVIFELLGDPNLQRDLYALSEFYHKSSFSFTLAEEWDLLQKLKTRCTATEIMVLSRKSLDKFDFLAKLDAAQIYNLISDEKAQVQGIVLTQLDHKRRMAVFDMYEGEPKITLMQELCRADAIPKEYLFNVAMALANKVRSRPEFDAEQLRSSDILLDLLEKADLAEQRQLMRSLQMTNPETARALKLKLVTVEILPYLKSGHLLEITLGMERMDLMMFLIGTREHIRSLLLAKAPPELAESWMEDLQTMAGVDEQSYRLVEMKVLGRVRALTSSGAISLLALNELIFQTGGPTVEQQHGTSPRLSTNAMVA